MISHHSLTDQQFEIQFDNCELAPELFSHEAHIRLAWIHINRYGIDQAITNILSQLRTYTRHVGAADKFNVTITVAACRAVYHFMLKSTTTTFTSFIKENERLLTQFKQLMEAHYSTNIFTSEVAKEAYLEPELLPFD